MIEERSLRLRNEYRKVHAGSRSVCSGFPQTAREAKTSLISACETRQATSSSSDHCASLDLVIRERGYY